MVARWERFVGNTSHTGSFESGTIAGLADARFSLSDDNAINQVNRPATFVAIDGHGDLGINGRMCA